MKTLFQNRFSRCSLLVLSAFFLLGFTGKEVSSDNNLYNISLEMQTKPMVGNNTLKLIVYDATTNKIMTDKLFIEVVPWMPSMDHGTNVASVVTDQGEGKYLVEMVHFTMPGPWQIHLKITRGNIEDTAVYGVEVIGPSHKMMKGQGGM